jgi:hypothetical protein
MELAGSASTVREQALIYALNLMAMEIPFRISEYKFKLLFYVEY